MRALDKDYQTWRQDRYRKFSDEFNTWRAARQAGTSASSTAASPGRSEAPAGGVPASGSAEPSPASVPPGAARPK